MVVVDQEVQFGRRWGVDPLICFEGYQEEVKERGRQHRGAPRRMNGLGHGPTVGGNGNPKTGCPSKLAVVFVNRAHFVMLLSSCLRFNGDALLNRLPGTLINT